MARFAFVSNMEGAPWGGSEVLWSQAANYMLAKGHDVFANVKKWPAISGPVQELVRAGAKIEFRSEASSAIGRRFARVVGKSRYRWLDEVRPEFLVLSDCGNRGCDRWMKEARERHIPYVTVAQAASEHMFNNPAWTDEISAGLDGAERNYFVSKSNLCLTRNQYGVRLENAEVIFNPVNVSNDVAVSWPSAERGWRLACVGRYELHAKGQDVLIEMLGMKKWQERDITVSFYGTGMHEALMHRLIDIYGVRNAKVEGFRTSVESIWAENHALVLPSRYEGLPLAVVEAMLCARPCIVTNRAGNAELLEDDVTGFVAATPSVSDLDEALERAWQRRTEWQKTGQLASESIRSVFPQDPAATFAEKLLSLLPTVKSSGGR